MRIIFSFSFFERIRFNQYQSTKQMTGFAGVVLSFSCCYSSFESEVIGLIHSFSSIAFLAARNFTPSFRKFGFNPYFVIPKSRDAWSEFGSFAAFLTLSLLSDPNELFFRVATVLKQHGVKYVIDSSAGTDIALIESREEFLHRYVIVFHAFLTLINPLPLLDIEKEWVLHG